MLSPYCEIVMSKYPAVKHTSYREYKQLILPYLEMKTGTTDFETICLIREPISWLNSWYRFRSREELRDPNHPNHENCTYGVSFSEFIAAYTATNSPPFAKLRTQYDFVSDEVGNKVDTIFLHERINDFVKYMSDKIGKELVLEKRNVSPRNNILTKFTSFLPKPVKNRVSHKVVSLSSNQRVELASHLLDSVREYIPNDFGLYESIKNS